jgi:hypothetical protein
LCPLPRRRSGVATVPLASRCPAAYRAGEYNWIYQTRAERADQSRHANDLCVYNADKDSVDHAALLVEYDNGIRLNFSFATTGQRHERHLVLIGQRGVIHASQADGTISVEPVGGEPETIVFPEELRGEHGGGDAPLVDSFLDCVAQDKRPVADVIAGPHSVALGMTATQSIDRGGAVIDLRPALATLQT